MKTKKIVNAEIAEIDESLSLLRDNWLVCSEKNKARYQKLINRMLDERLVCMKERDELAAAAKAKPKTKAKTKEKKKKA